MTAETEALIHGLDAVKDRLARLGELAEPRATSHITALVELILEQSAQLEAELPKFEEDTHTVDDVVAYVARVFHLDAVRILSRDRTQRVAYARQLCCYLIRRLSKLSFPAIGAAFGRDHSTVIHSCNLIERRVGRDPAFALQMDKMERGVKGERQMEAAA